MPSGERSAFHDQNAIGLDAIGGSAHPASASGSLMIFSFI
jgi:hypothetical protein